ncbi:hypothetical protein TNCT_27601 [Trichonephila clavata]|uniref:Uncharacterized protein n=1 Tax=Trichonephila clavata TaxID=2740835 RepID=A0A8X6F5X5_TRICU|nr:hypothetical protein TNCT_27601 [Trichonephila clavata]
MPSGFLQGLVKDDSSDCLPLEAAVLLMGHEFLHAKIFVVDASAIPSYGDVSALLPFTPCCFLSSLFNCRSSLLWNTYF